MSIKKPIKKFTRGTIGFVAIKLCFVAIFLFVQACADNIEPEDPMVRYERFLKKQGRILAKAARTTRGTIDGELQLQSSDPVVQQVMDDTFNESKAFLTSFNFQENELREELGDMYDVGVIYVAMAAYEAEKEWGNTSTGPTPDDNLLEMQLAEVVFGINPVQAEESIGTCLLEAVGVGALYDWAVGKAVLSRRALIRAVGKFLSRSLGWVGTALAVADFVWCMNRE